jgi:hypothetical protein
LLTARDRICKNAAISSKLKHAANRRRHTHDERVKDAISAARAHVSLELLVRGETRRSQTEPDVDVSRQYDWDYATGHSARRARRDRTSLSTGAHRHRRPASAETDDVFGAASRQPSSVARPPDCPRDRSTHHRAGSDQLAAHALPGHLHRAGFTRCAPRAHLSRRLARPMIPASATSLTIRIETAHGCR